MTSRALAIVIVIGLFLGLACKDGQGGYTCFPGNEDCPCVGGVCLAGLECVDDTCVVAGGVGSTGTAGTDTGTESSGEQPTSTGSESSGDASTSTSTGTGTSGTETDGTSGTSGTSGTDTDQTTGTTGTTGP